MEGIEIEKQFSKIVVGSFQVKLSPGEQYVKLHSGVVVAVENIVTDVNGSIWLIYRKFHGADNFFMYPSSSMDIGIFKFERLGSCHHYCACTDIVCKYIVLPYKRWHIAIPVAHTNSD